VGGAKLALFLDVDEILVAPPGWSHAILPSPARSLPLPSSLMINATAASLSLSSSSSISSFPSSSNSYDKLIGSVSFASRRCAAGRESRSSGGSDPCAQGPLGHRKVGRVGR
jgi:hypothetical protein